MAYKNPEDQKACAKKHYQDNKELYKSRAKASNRRMRKRNRAFIIGYKKTHPCVDCNEDNFVVLEFDHVKGKKICNVGDMGKNATSIKKIKEEIAKCEVVCANCHRKRTFSRNGLD